MLFKINYTRIFVVCILIILILLGLTYVNRYHVAQVLVGTVNKVDVEWMGYTTEKIVCLTFDDGPDPRYTPEVLSILKKYQIPAAFFLVGSNIEKYPELVLDEVRAGFEIGNHTYTHPHLILLHTNDIKQQIIATDEKMVSLIGRKPIIFRPPYQELTENILNVSRELDKKIVMSTITIEHESAKTPAEKASRVMNLIFPGSIILAHDGRLDRSQTIKTLPILIEGLKAKGYRFVSLKELLKKKL